MCELVHVPVEKTILTSYANWKLRPVETVIVSKQFDLPPLNSHAGQEDLLQGDSSKMIIALKDLKEIQVWLVPSK